MDRESRLRELSARRTRFAATLTAIMVVMYFGFILLIAFNKPLMGSSITPGLSVGILLGALVIIASWVMTWVYVRWANTNYDRPLSELHE